MRPDRFAKLLSKSGEVVGDYWVGFEKRKWENGVGSEQSGGYRRLRKDESMLIGRRWVGNTECGWKVKMAIVVVDSKRKGSRMTISGWRTCISWWSGRYAPGEGT